MVPLLASARGKEGREEFRLEVNLWWGRISLARLVRFWRRDDREPCFGGVRAGNHEDECISIQVSAVEWNKKKVNLNDFYIESPSLSPFSAM